MKRALWLCVCVVSLPALAEDVEISLRAVAQLGKQPAVELRINTSIDGFRLELERGDGKAFSWKGGGRPGTTRLVPLEHRAEGVQRWKGRLVVLQRDGQQASLPLDFQTEVQGPLKLSIDRASVDLERRVLRFSLNRPVSRVHLRVLLDTGVALVDEDLTFAGEPAGQLLPLQWPAHEDRVLLIDVRAFDQAGFYDSVELTPWQIDIPHEEVTFELGSWEVRPDQRTRLEESYALITSAVAKHGHLARLTLFIAGHTDTVGAEASNRLLSLRRARALGAWFRRRGLRLPVLVEGFGEQALLVATPDESAEPRNRRAEYIIAIDAPAARQTSFRPVWQPL